MSNKANEKSPNILVDTNENKKVLYTKHDELWVFVEQYLILLRHMGVKKDLKFMRLFNKLMEYVRDKLKLPENGGAILDMYHVVCQERIEVDN